MIYAFIIYVVIGGIIGFAAVSTGIKRGDTDFEIVGYVPLAVLFWPAFWIYAFFTNKPRE